MERSCVRRPLLVANVIERHDAYLGVKVDVAFGTV
jgi:hypothetical protein